MTLDSSDDTSLGPDVASAPPLDVEQIRQLLERAFEPLLVLDRDLRLLYANQAALSSLQPGEAEALLSQPEARRTVQAVIEQKAAQISPPLRVDLKPERGRVRLHASPICTRDGAVQGFLVGWRPCGAGFEPGIEHDALLGSILENFPTPFFTVDPQLTITYMNEPMERLTGYRRSEVVGKLTCGAVLRTSRCNTSSCLLLAAMQTKRPIAGMRGRIRNRQDCDIPVVIHASLITDAAGNVVGGFEAIRDISAVVEAEKKIELLAEMTQEGILMVDEHQRIIFANSRMVEFTGLPKEKLLGRPASDFLSADQLETLSEMLARANHQGEPVRFCSTTNLGMAGAADRTFETCMAASQVGDSRVGYIYLRDLTARIDIERQLRKANSFLNKIIQSSVDGIVVVDTKGKVLIFNEGAERILGFTAKEMVGEHLSKFYDVDLAREVMRRMRSNQFGPPGKLNPTRLHLYHKSGERIPVNFSAALIEIEGQEIGSVGIFSDLRENERLRRELEEAQRQVVHAEKIASLGRLAAGVAHEINNPLAGILIYADMLMRELQDNKALRGDLEEIINQTLRCKQIVTRLLEFSRQSLGQRLLFDVNEVIKQCADLLCHQALFHDIEITFDFDPELPQILGDPGELQQVFTNLLLNAADAMEGQGSIRIHTSHDRENDQVVLQFADTGPGIPPELVDKIFEPFFTTKPLGKGTGLGLSVVYGVIQRHGGSIEVDSSPGEGTCFTIRLPLESPAGGENSVPEGARSAPP